MVNNRQGNQPPTLLLGRYQVQGVQSEDDLSATLTAFDPQQNRTVTIETLRFALLSDPAARSALDERSSRQMEAGSRVGNHPHLVAVYDLLRDAAAIPYLIREFLPGGSLTERLRSGPLPFPEALRITADCARGLQAAHNVGLVHRDVTPAHIFFTATGQAKVGGFGSVQIDDLADETMTASGVPAVSHYLSPEQIDASGYVPPASDQYGLGVVLYEMLTGTPYDRQHLSDAQARLAMVPTPVAALTERMTEERPENRYAAMRDVVAAITAIEGALTPAQASADEPPAHTMDNWSPPPAYPPAAPPPIYPPQPPPAIMPPPPAPVRTAKPKRTGRRVVLFGLGGLVLAGAAGGAYLFVNDQNDKGGKATPAATGGATPTAATVATAAATAAPTVAPTATVPPATIAPTIPPTNTPLPTRPPVPLATFSPKAIAADMTDQNQWNVISVEQSARTLQNGAYTVRVSKSAEGKGLLSWGDWIPKNVTLTPQFMAETEVRLTGDPKGACGGILFLFNYVSANDQQQFLTFLVRGDGNFGLFQQLPGGGGGVARIDWTTSRAIKTEADAVNIPRVSVRDGKLTCGVNGVEVAQLPVPAELASFKGFALAARVLAESGQPDASAIFRNLRYEPVTG